MASYKEMYFTLIRAQRDAILVLQEAHQKAEEMVLSADVPDHLRVIRLNALPKGEQIDIHCLNLSGRTYNALKYRFSPRDCRDYVPTINDVLSITSYEQLKKIRNLGKKSCSELIFKMQEAGFTDWTEQIFRSTQTST